MERGPRFGENFNPEETNRLDVLKKQDLPEYVDISREIRAKLNESIETAGWPQCPQDIESVDQFFEAAKNTVTKRWNDFAFSSLQDRLASWTAKLPEGDDYSDIKKTLSSPDKLENRLAQNQFEILEPLRDTVPEAWKTLVLASSERQLAAAVLLRRWVK